MIVKAYAARKPGGELMPFEYDCGELGPADVDIDVRYCGVCHSDLSMLDNDWELTKYPFVPGHEIVGVIAGVGSRVKHLKSGQIVGVGWFSSSCMTCRDCMGGDHNLCVKAEGIIVGRHGGFADTVRIDSGWVVPLPSGLNPATSGPLFCGGITVFNPIIQNNIRPTQRVGVVGLGGLGHLAIRYLNVWGCEVTAFSTSPDKEAEVRDLGAHNFVNTRDPVALDKLVDSLDLILVTVNVELDWNHYISLLRPRGILHLVGAAPSVSAAVFPLLLGQKSIKGSPLGSPATIQAMLEFSARHAIEPIVEELPMSQVNEAIAKLRAGKPRYRLVLKAGE